MLKKKNLLTEVVEMASAPIPKVPYPEHPNRCQAIMGVQGQCQNLSIEGVSNCIVHGGAKAASVQRDKEMQRYNVALWRDKISRHAESDDLKNLNAEIGVLRMSLEVLLESCKNDVDLITNSPMISDMVLKIDKLVNSCHRLDDKLGNLLDKSAIIAFAASVVEIVSNEIDDQAVVASIADRITQALAKGTNDDDL